MSGSLFVVSTPIGNVGDITRRAIETLGRVAWVAAEDTRRTGLLLHELGLKARLVSCHDHNERERTSSLLARLLDGEDVALVSDAGTPLISDPGYGLVRACQDAGVPVIPVPGASAVMAALSVAGLPTDRFIFEGFLPHRGASRDAALSRIARLDATAILFEAPHRILALLEALCVVAGEQREAVLCRELTKTWETVIRGTLADLRDRVAADGNQQRGEIVLVLSGAEFAPDDASLRHLGLLLLEELPPSRAARILAAWSGESRQKLYALLQDLNQDTQ